MPASLDAIFGIMGYQSSLILGALYVRLSEGSLVSIAPCSVRSNCLLYLEVKRIVVLSSPIVCSVVREWWTGADCTGISQVLSGLHVRCVGRGGRGGGRSPHKICH